MGYLTTITIHNDRFQDIKNNPDEFMEIIENAVIGGMYYDVEPGLGIIAQRSRHADDATVYVHMGNTLVDMNAFGDQTKSLAKNHPDFFDRLLRELKLQTKALTKLQKKQKSK